MQTIMIPETNCACRGTVSFSEEEKTSKFDLHLDVLGEAGSSCFYSFYCYDKISVSCIKKMPCHSESIISTNQE